MVKKVVAAAAAAGGIVLAGAGLAVADTGTVNAAGGYGTNVSNPACGVNSSDYHHPGWDNGPDSGPRGPKHTAKPHHPAEHHEREKPHGPARDHEADKPHAGPEQLAETGAEELGLTLAAGTVLILGGSVLFRRGRAAARS